MTRLLRISVWAINALLITLCAYWTATLLLAGARNLAGGGNPMLQEIAQGEATAHPTWEQRRVILDKNLFKVSTLLPQATQPETAIGADLDETDLPLELIGTIASTVQANARASVRITRENRTLSLQVGDEVIDGATVHRIERRRVVIENRGSLEALSLDDEEKTAQTTGNAKRRTGLALSRRATGGTSNRATRATRRTSPTPVAAPNSDALRDPSQIVSQARFLPRYEDGTGKLQGIGVDAVRTGSLLEDIGMRDGDTIVELNGLDIAGAEDASELMREMAEIEDFEVVVVGQDGSRRTLEYSYE